MTALDTRSMRPIYADWSLAPVWKAVAAVLLAGAWLQPNHYFPWPAFHADAWTAVVMLIGAAVVLATTRAAVAWTVPGAIGTAMVAALGVQFGLGQIASFGHFFVNAAYFLGFILAVQIGQLCEVSRARDDIVDAFFLGIGIAGFVSVAIQLHQWLALPLPEYWVMDGGADRPYANLGQPNQLATLLVWAMLAVGWSVWRKATRPSIATAAVCILLMGLALTRSRAGMLEVSVLVAAAWGWRALWPSKRLLWLLFGLVASYVTMLVLLPWLAVQLMPDVELHGPAASILNTGSGSARLALYKMFVSALAVHPLVGYGWSQLTLAQLEMATQVEPMHVLYVHAHNLFLDVALGFGAPLGLLFAVVTLAWVARSVLRVQRADHSILLLMALTLGMHSMLELPLHHGYFLWPVGFAMGLFAMRVGTSIPVPAHRGFVMLLWLTCVLACSFIVYDYIRAEEEYRVTRFEALRVGRTPEGPRPEMIVLTQLGDLLWIARVHPRADMSRVDIDRVNRVASMYPSTPAMLKAAETLALNAEAGTATRWLLRLQHISSEKEIQTAKLYWTARSVEIPPLAAVPWPAVLDSR